MKNNRFSFFSFTTLIALFAACYLLLPAMAWGQTYPAADSEKLAAMGFGLLIGVVLAAAAYLFFIWLAVRDRGQVFLLIFLLCIGANIAMGDDMLMNHIGLYDLSGREFLTSLSIMASWIFGLFFTYHFLELEDHNPAYKKPFSVAGTLLLLVLLYSSLDHSFLSLVMPAIAALTVSIILISALSGVRNHIGGSLVHIVAFICFLGGAMAEPSYALGFIRSPADTHNVTYIAFASSALLFAIVVASQFAARQEEKERELALSNERFVLATRGANEGLFDWNLATGEVFFSDQFRKIIGTHLGSGNEGLKKWVRLMLVTDRRLVVAALRRFRHNAGKTDTLNVEYRIIQSNGERRWLHSKAVAMRDRTTKKVLRLVGSTSDITARKQSEFALKASETRFRSITEAHPVPVLIVSITHATILYATPGAETLLGMPQARMRMEPVYRFLPDEAKRNHIWQAILAGHSVDLEEVEIRHADGHIIPGGLSARRISYQNEDAIVVGLYDLTERKKNEAQIAQQQEALQQSEKMAALGGLLAGVAHELNNPLSVVVGQATLLMEGTPEAKVANRAEKIFKAADRCARIVKSFLALARRKAPERKPVDLNRIIRAAMELLGYQLRSGEVDIKLDLDPALPEITGDDDQLTQVVTNLVLNAAQALAGWAGKHQVVITTRRGESADILISIADTGPGIPAEIRHRIFEPFFTTKGSKGGTGVGLALCHNLVESHGGELILTDTPGGGATFTVKLPAGSAVETTAILTQRADDPKSRPLRLLLVDDEIEIAQTLADLLESDGHDIDIAINGSIALDKLRKTSFDAIISDLRMPVMDGPSMYKALLEEMPHYLDKIMFVTGDTLSTHVQEFLVTHTVSVIEKPYRLKDIRAALNKLSANLADS